MKNEGFKRTPITFQNQVLSGLMGFGVFRRIYYGKSYSESEYKYLLKKDNVVENILKLKNLSSSNFARKHLNIKID